MNQNQTDPIDAVITWVDGNDPIHSQKRAQALQEIEGISSSKLPTGHHKTRFLTHGEIEWCIKSIRRFIPWVRRIFLITDNQTPGFLTSEIKNRYNVTVVDHTEVFSSYEWALPTFNSRTIETAIWRIPELSEKFIYFNDDFVITKPLQREHFFKNGKVVIRGVWRKISNYGKLRMQFNRFYSRAIKKLLGVTHSMHLLYQIRSAKLAGFKRKYYYVPHVPHPVKKSTLESYFSNHTHLFKRNIQYKFRNTDQFGSIYLSYHLEIDRKNAVLIEPDTAMMINGEMDFSGSIKRKIAAIKKGDIELLCIQGMEIIKPKQKKHLIDTLSALIEK